MAEQLNFQINIGGQERTVATLGELKKAIKDAEFEALKLSQQFGEADPRVQKLRGEIGKLKDAVQDSAAATANFAKGAGAFPVIARSLQGIASGFAAVQGAMGLLGLESEDVAKSLLKVQSALALATGLEALVESIDQFGNLVALIETRVIPALYSMSIATKTALGVVVGAITTAIAAWVEYENAQERAKKAEEERLKSKEKGDKAYLEGVLASLERNRKYDLAYLNSKKASDQEIFEKEQYYLKERLKYYENYYNSLENKDSDNALATLKTIKDLNTEIQVAELNHLTKINEIREKDVQDEKDRLQKIEDANREAQSRMMALWLQALENKSQKAKEDAKADEDYLAQQWANEEALQAKRIDASNKRIIDEKNAKDALINAEQQLLDARFAMAGATVQLFAAMAGQNEKMANALFVVDKALAVAKVIVDMYAEIAGYARANSVYGPAGQAITAAQTAAAKWRAGASIAVIVATTIAKFKNGTTAGFGGGTGTLGVAPIVPQLPTAQATFLNQETINALGNQAVRAYVVETDMTTNQQRIQAIRQRARFG